MDSVSETKFQPDPHAHALHDRRHLHLSHQREGERLGIRLRIQGRLWERQGFKTKADEPIAVSSERQTGGQVAEGNGLLILEDPLDVTPGKTSKDRSTLAIHLLE